MDRRWRIRFFGGLCAERRGERITRFRTQKTASLLAYLAYHLDAPQSREALCDLLWPEVEPGISRHRLNVALSALRQLLESGRPEGPLLCADRTSVQLRPALIASDVMEFTEALGAAAKEGDATEQARFLREALALYGGEFLPGHYDPWVLRERGWLAERYFQALRQWLIAVSTAGALDEALAEARRGLRLDPLREEIHQQLIRILMAMGQPAAALGQYRQLEALLHEELGARPTETSQRLALEIRRLVEQDRTSVAAPRPRPDAKPRTNLPLALTRFIGRERERSDLKEQLEEHRLVTLTGAGGCGKTRLALETARELVEVFADGVWWCDMAPVTEPNLVPQRVAEALGLHDEPGLPLTSWLVGAIRSSHMLLVLDNCEHLIEACAGLTETLLQSCPRLRILATSREPLALPGERRVVVPSLAVPEEGQSKEPERLFAYDSVILLAERASAVRPGFRVTASNKDAVVSVCCRLDGIPLAIELAAARTAAMTIDQIAARLDDCFAVLIRGSRTALPRHRTLQASIDWSYGLLSAREQLLLCRLAVFAGNWSLEAAEAICSGEGIKAREVSGLLTELVAKSLVVYEEPPVISGAGQARYRLLETVRQYALARLSQQGAVEAMRRRHRDFFLALVEQAAPLLQGAEQATWLERLELKHDNLRSALEWSLENDPAGALRLAAGLSGFWEIRGHFSEGSNSLQRALAKDDGSSPGLRMDALDGAERLAYFLGDFALQRRLLTESLQLHRESEDRQGAARVLNRLALGAVTGGDYDAGRAWCEEGVELLRKLALKGRAQLIDSLLTAGMVALCQGDFNAARAFDRETLAIARALGDRRAAASALQNTGLTFVFEGDPEAARRPLEEALETFQELKDQFGLARCYYGLGHVARDLGEFSRARSHYQTVLRWVQESGLKWGISHTLDGFAHLAARERKWARAARLLAAVDSIGQSLHSPIPPAHVPAFRRNVAAAREALGEEMFSALWAEGSEMSVEDAIRYAMEE